jgi:hypothetical protein
VDQLLDLSYHRLPSFHNSLFVSSRLPGRLLRPEVEIALADEIIWVSNVHVFCNGAAGAEKAALSIFEINLVGRVLEQETEKILPEGESI